MGNPCESIGETVESDPIQSRQTESETKIIFGMSLQMNADIGKVLASGLERFQNTGAK